MVMHVKKIQIACMQISKHFKTLIQIIAGLAIYCNKMFQPLPHTCFMFSEQPLVSIQIKDD